MQEVTHTLGRWTPTHTWETQKAVLHHVSLTFAVRCTQLRYTMRKVVLHNEYHHVIICHIHGVRRCMNWSAEKIVHITFLYIVYVMRWCRYKCEKSQNIVTNVYNSLQSSFLPLAWPWPGRSLPKGNQWECWDPGLGPNVVGLPVNLPPKYTPNIPYTSDAPWCPHNGSQHPLQLPSPLMPLYPFWPLSTGSPCHPPIHCWHPTPPDASLTLLMAQHPLGTPNAPLCHLYPFWPLSSYTPCQPQYTPDTPYTPDAP